MKMIWKQLQEQLNLMKKKIVKIRKKLIKQQNIEINKLKELDKIKAQEIKI